MNEFFYISNSERAKLNEITKLPIDYFTVIDTAIIDSKFWTFDNGFDDIALTSVIAHLTTSLKTLPLSFNFGFGYTHSSHCNHAGSLIADMRYKLPIKNVEKYISENSISKKVTMPLHH